MQTHAEPGDQRSGLTQVCLLGQFAISHDSAPVLLPPSRKLRALVAYLALARQAVARERLCELLWDIPNDPRGELRWCLCKARSLLDRPMDKRVYANNGFVWLELSQCQVDALQLAEAVDRGLGKLDTAGLKATLALCRGDFLEGLVMDRNPFFNTWLMGQRRRTRACQVAIVEALVSRLSSQVDERLHYLDAWLQLAPFDRRAHELMLHTLAERGQLREGEEHLALASRAFSAEGMDCLPLRRVWREAKAATTTAPAHSSTREASHSDIDAPKAARPMSIVVLPFSGTGTGLHTACEFAQSMAYDITNRLVRQRRLYVMASAEAAQSLVNRSGQDKVLERKADYVVSGSVFCTTKRFKIDVQLIQVRTAQIVWVGSFRHRTHGAFHVYPRVVNRIASAIESEVQAVESKGIPTRLNWSDYRVSPGKIATAIRARPGALRARRRLLLRQPGDSPSTRSLPIEDVSMRRPVRPPADSG